MTDLQREAYNALNNLGNHNGKWVLAYTVFFKKYYSVLDYSKIDISQKLGISWQSLAIHFKDLGLPSYTEIKNYLYQTHMTICGEAECVSYSCIDDIIVKLQTSGKLTKTTCEKFESGDIFFDNSPLIEFEWTDKDIKNLKIQYPKRTYLRNNSKLRAKFPLCVIWKKADELGLKYLTDEEENCYEDHLGNRYKTYSEMCERYEIPYLTYHNRIMTGWSVKAALTTPKIPDGIFVRRVSEIGGIAYFKYKCNICGYKDIGTAWQIIEHTKECKQYVSQRSFRK